MLVNLKISSKNKINNGDLLIAKEDGSFEFMSKDEFLSEIVEMIEKQNKEISSIKTTLHKHSSNITYLLKKENKKSS